MEEKKGYVHIKVEKSENTENAEVVAALIMSAKTILEETEGLKDGAKDLLCTVLERVVDDLQEWSKEEVEEEESPENDIDRLIAGLKAAGAQVHVIKIPIPEPQVISQKEDATEFVKEQISAFIEKMKGGK